MRAALAAAILVGLAIGPAAAQSAAPASPSGANGQQGEAAPIKTASDIAPALRKCWNPPPMDGASEITVTLRFKSDGSISGEPYLASAHRFDMLEIKDLKESLTSALAACHALPLSESLGKSVAGQAFAVKFAVADKKATH